MLPDATGKTLTLAIAGARGSIFGTEMLRLLAADSRVAHIDLVVSDAALRVLAEDLQLSGRNDLVESSSAHPARRSSSIPMKISVPTDERTPLLERDVCGAFDQA